MFFSLLNKIKINNIIKKKNLITNINNKELNFLKKLIKMNIIKFVFKKNNKYIIILNLYKKNKLIFNIKNLYNTSNYKYLKYKNIKKINKKNKLLIISSNKGIINNYEAETKKTGGVIIAFIWN
jgi:ribosomal protein S8